MPDRLPIQDAKEIAHKRGLRQVILLAWDGAQSHVVTYGKSIEDCDQAAQGGEKMKKLMGWPNWEAQPSRVKRLTSALERADRIIGWMASYLGRMAPPSNGIADLNEHWLEMPKLLKTPYKATDWRGPKGEDERPLDQHHDHKM
jgi:hypothetical protein